MTTGKPIKEMLAANLNKFDYVWKKPEYYDDYIGRTIQIEIFEFDRFASFIAELLKRLR